MGADGRTPVPLLRTPHHLISVIPSAVGLALPLSPDDLLAELGLDACGFIRRSLIIWDKGHIVPSRRSLQLETRVVLVRRQEGRESQLAGRAQSLDPLGDRQPQEI